MQWVVDASVALAWCFEDEKSDRTEALADRLQISPAVVPQTWRLEIANALLVAARRERLSIATRTQLLLALARLPVQVGSETSDRAFQETLALADAHQLTIYDAAYLELALRLAIPLATNDDALRRAAEAVGVELL